MAVSQPNKATKKWEDEKEEEGERPGWWKTAWEKVMQEEAIKKEAEWARKRQEEAKAKRKRKGKARCSSV
jgi:hypothetical protein